jgi:DNA polymerase III delta prime subunit
MTIQTIERETDWAQKYRPTKLEDMILPDSIKNSLIAIRENNGGPSLLLKGRAGTGKTTAATLLNPRNVHKINCSMENKQHNVAALNNFSSWSVNLDDGIRVIVMDESEYLTEAAQSALRATIEDLSFANLFVFTANEPQRLIPPLHSRLVSIDFNVIYGDINLKAQMVKRACEIIENEGLAIKDASIVNSIVGQYFPDMRQTLKQLQFQFQLN